jgi:hypothetical protein
LINFGGIGGEHLPGAGSVRNGSQDGAVGGAIPFFVEPQNFAYELNIFEMFHLASF